jgi:tetratricopeptide (TPR) repeat protein
LEVAEEGFREALRLKEESAGRDDHPELAKTWNALGAMYYGLLDEKHQALECFRTVLWITRSNSTRTDHRTDPDVMAAIQTISDIQEQIDQEKRYGKDEYNNSGS